MINNIKDKIKKQLDGYMYTKKIKIDWEYTIINFFKKLFRRKWLCLTRLRFSWVQFGFT